MLRDFACRPQWMQKKRRDPLDTDTRPAAWLVCRVGRRLAALPLENVVETMRPLPIEPLSGAPSFVLGLSLIRGSPVPVVDIGSMFGEATVQPRRLVTLNAGGRRVALVVESVLGIRSIRADELSNLPPLLRDAGGDVVSAVGILDAELLLFLRAARMVPHAVLDVLGAAGAA